MVEGLLVPEMQLATDSSTEHTRHPQIPQRNLIADLRQFLVLRTLQTIYDF